MKVLLINSPTRDRAVVRDMAGGLGFDGGEAVILPPLELAYMAATLRGKGHDVRILDADVEGYSQKDVFRSAVEYEPDAVAATVSLPSLDRDCSFLKEMRRHTSARVAAKTGINYPALLKEILEKSSAELCIYGECDLHIDRILTGEEKKGTAHLDAGECVVEENHLIADLDALPLPARDLLPNERYRYVLLGERVTTMQTSRGCPFPCAYYCPYPLVQGRKWRSRSAHHVIAEIEDIVRNHRIHKILFRDATLTVDKSRVVEICREILRSRLRIEWWCETRVDCLDVDLMREMKQAGCLGMNIGVETGDPAVMETQAKIGLTLDKLKSTREIAQELGLKLHFLLMIGLPGETRDSLYKTYNLVRDLKPESFGVCVITPYPGTPLYEEAKEKGWIETEDWAKFGGHHPIMHTDQLSSDDLLKARQFMDRGLFLAYKGSIGSALSRILDRRFKKWASR
jgi:radical SAM superfamily enzyme YgiQ (UPF0313 family)